MYKRPTPKPEKQFHPIHGEFRHYGFIDVSNDPAWISYHMKELMDDARYALHQFSSTITQVKSMDMSEYRREVAEQKQTEIILKAERSLKSFLKKHIEKYRSECDAVSNSILRVTEPVNHNDPTRSLLQEMRFREIRDNLRNIEPRKRKEAIAGSLERLQAVISNPDRNDVIIAPDALTELRREYAFKQDPSLVNQEKDQQLIYKAVRSRAAEINATASKMLIYAKIDDPLPPAEHFDVFPPETEHEAVYASRRIQAWQKKEDEKQRRKTFDDDNEGLNLEAGQRATRIDRGIHHE